jgi:hypothetical protein
VSLDPGLLKHAELGLYEQLGPAPEVQKEMPIRRRPQSLASIPRRRAIVKALWITCYFGKFEGNVMQDTEDPF